ncbi:MAG TPA: D-alanine--D-alanine ligase [Phycisphaerae bacterium]|nr:D-alanine--D-alanine ligase [Phycisphaerae bacterium]HNU45443.1 D-alanine--D-alanine ligase [Phycisphaerae bacterium]
MTTVGLTYDLRDDYLAAGYGEEETAEFDRPETIDAIEAALRELGYRTERIGHVRQLVDRLARGERWDLVFNIAEGLRGVSREAQVPSILEAFDIPYTFSDPLICALTLHKAMTKRVLRDLGLPTPAFCVVASEAEVQAVDLPFPLFVKPLAEGTGKGIDGRSMVQSQPELAQACRRVLQTFEQPALVEVYLSGREFTVGITGTGAEAAAIGTLAILLQPGAEQHSYTHVNKEQWQELCRYELAAPDWARRAEELALAAWRGLGCRDGGRIDLRATADGTLHVLELNPLPGLCPGHSDLPILCTMAGVPYVELIRRITDSAWRRVTSPARQSAECSALA